MLKRVEVLTILMILFLNAGCSEHKPNNIFDCERIKDSSKRDECFISFVEEIPANNTGLRVGICEKLVGVELRDACFFKTAQDVFRVVPRDDGLILCTLIGNKLLKESCSTIYSRPHLYSIQ